MPPLYRQRSAYRYSTCTLYTYIYKDIIGVLRRRTGWSVEWWISDLYDLCSRKVLGGDFWSDFLHRL